MTEFCATDMSINQYIVNDKSASINVFDNSNEIIVSI